MPRPARDTRRGGGGGEKRGGDSEAEKGRRAGGGGGGGGGGGLKALANLDAESGRIPGNRVGVTQRLREIVAAHEIVPVGDIFTPHRDRRVPLADVLAHAGV